jgi:hypothetical protein
MEDELLEIADDGRNDWGEKRNDKGEVTGWTVNGEHIQRSRARIDTRKWLMGKCVPKKYGDKVEQAVQGWRAAQCSRRLPIAYFALLFCPVTSNTRMLL